MGKGNTHFSHFPLKAQISILFKIGGNGRERIKFN